MRELVYYVAVTLDGFIAHPDGSFDKFPWDADYGADMAENFPETLPAHLRSAEHRCLENRWFDAVLMGRNTYEVGLKEGIASPYPTLRQYVFSRSYNESPDPQVTIVSSDAVEVVQKLKQEDGKPNLALRWERACHHPADGGPDRPAHPEAEPGGVWLGHPALRAGRHLGAHGADRPQALPERPYGASLHPEALSGPARCRPVR